MAFPSKANLSTIGTVYNACKLWRYNRGRDLGLMRSSPRLVQGAWVRCAVRGTPGCSAMSLSKSFLKQWPRCPAQARFEREVQVLASLNHPNIAAIYGLEESTGVRALVMELVEGETKQEKIEV